MWAGVLRRTLGPKPMQQPMAEQRRMPIALWAEIPAQEPLVAAEARRIPAQERTMRAEG